MKVFDDKVYEQQRLNIERLAAQHPDDWFFQSQMEKPPQQRTGFAPLNRRCYRCGRIITEGEHGITLKDLGDYIITGCPYCHKSYCD